MYGRRCMVQVTMIAPHLQQYRAYLEQRVSAPIRVSVPASFREEDVLPLVPTAEIVITSHWSRRLGELAGALRFLQVPGAGWDKIDPAGIPPGVLVANCYEHERAIAEWVLMM